MKIILGTPRSGTSFVTNWYANHLTDHEYLYPEFLGEYFHPDFFKTDDVDQETLDRISTLTELSIFKLHTGYEMSRFIWDFISDHPIILVTRDDTLGQFLSYGIGYTTAKWVNYSATNHNGLEPGQTIDYKKEWFDELVNRFEHLKQLLPSLTIEEQIKFEDLSNYTINGRLPRRQNPQSNAEKLELLSNKNQFIDWYEEYERKNIST